MDIVGHSNLNTAMLDAVARAALGKATSGVSVGGGVSRIHLMNYNQPEQQRASDVLNHFGALLVTADATRLSPGDAHAVVRCADERIAADSQLAYLVLRGEAVIDQGKVTVTDGQCSFALSDLEIGTYDVLLFQLAGQFASGALRIELAAP